MSLLIPVKCGEEEAQAVIDTAAQATLVNQDFFLRLPGSKETLDKGKVIMLKGLADVPVEATRIPRFSFQLGNSKFTWDVFVTSMTDQFILGLDFLNHHGGQVDLRTNTVTINGEDLGAQLKKGPEGDVKVSRVFLTKRTVVPPNSIVHAMVKFDKTADTSLEYYLESTKKNKGLLISHALVTAPKTPIRILNDSNMFVTLRKRHQVAVATEVELALDGTVDVQRITTGSPDVKTGSMTVCPEIGETTAPAVSSGSLIDCPTSPNNSGHQITKSSGTLPNKLEDLYKRSISCLNTEQAAELRDLLIEFEDVFAAHDLDLGCFTGVKHSINTRDAPPFRQKMRHTPLGFEKEEEGHLQKMLDLGIIVPSSSEWASAPVLVRKKDGSVRYCIDFRQLNSLTVKDAFPLPLIEDCLDSLAGTTYFSTLDMAS